MNTVAWREALRILHAAYRKVRGTLQLKLYTMVLVMYCKSIIYKNFDR
jgi:hypothetical protein